MEDEPFAERPLTISFRSAALERADAVTCLLGSFDPVHRGHLFMLRRALLDSDALIALVPQRHFDKHIVRGRNADLGQRQQMLRLLPPDVASRTTVGRTCVVLFIELIELLEAELPGQELRFAMGDDTFDKLLASEAYFAASGRPFGPRERATLQRLRDTTLVFARHRRASGWTQVPADVIDISSTKVRGHAAKLVAEERRGGRIARAHWRQSLHPLITRSVADYLFDHRPYRGGLSKALPSRPRSSPPPAAAGFGPTDV